MANRLYRYQEKKLKKRIAIGIIGGISLILFMAFFGMKLLIGFSLFVEWLKGGDSEPVEEQVFISAPILDPIPDATNSARFVVTGKGDPGYSVTLILNDSDSSTETADEEGSFRFPDVMLSEGKNTIAVRQEDGDGNRSMTGTIMSILLVDEKPKLTIDSPQNGSEIRGQENRVAIIGDTCAECSISVNGRLAIVAPDGTFRYQYTLTDGENEINVTATNTAGNQTTETINIRYSP